MNPPKKIRILQYDFEVVETDALVDHRAHMDPNQLKIRIHTQLPKQLQAVLFWHEILHAIHTAGGFPDELNEERICESYSGPLTQLVRDNDYLFTWMAWCLCQR